MTTFGVDFQLHLQDSSTEEENIPHIITSCIDEIDQRGKQTRTVKESLSSTGPGALLLLFTSMKSPSHSYQMVTQIAYTM